MEIRVDKFLALTAMLAGFVPVTTPTIDPGRAAGEGEGEDAGGDPGAGAKFDEASDGGPGAGVVRG